MHHKISYWLSLPAAEWRLVIAALVLLPLFHLRLRSRAVACTSLLDPFQAKCSRRPTVSPERTARLVHRCSQIVLGERSCLTRAVYLAWLLGRRGLRPELRIGVARNARHLDAHAWIELDGAALEECADIYARYLPLICADAARDTLTWQVLLRSA